jgi:TRAP-type C4-dicarboxylate transport system substrate-binding protein
LLEIVNRNFDDAAIKERADLLAMERSLQADLTAKGMTFNKPDPVQFRAALVKAGFYTQWQTIPSPAGYRHGWTVPPIRTTVRQAWS